MRDGRIHKIETIAPSSRNDTINKLRGELSHSTGLGLADRNSRFTSTTEIRKPQFYSTHSVEGEEVGRFLVSNLKNVPPEANSGDKQVPAENGHAQTTKELTPVAPPSDNPSSTTQSPPNVGGVFTPGEVEMQEMYSQVIINGNQPPRQGSNLLDPHQHISITIPDSTANSVGVVVQQA